MYDLKLWRLNIFKCTTAICEKKQNRHFVVPASKFKLLQGQESLTIYTFNTHKAKHMFCKTCGVQSFYIPRSNPDGYGVMPHCLDKGTVQSSNINYFDGQNWEDFIEKSDIRQKSVDS
ncbi:hypothetical protein KUTeg_009969 [Tegillarca granosa]|uniref:CENP-V/GFA domain-containing protein n=1 Tax=Tegillarca granosa TaxID=220873 RepID=A0ABQ9F8N7_TEGGR|nr:hypothetical protein KUTeg_009969 [Tegillarca granosa]